MPDLFDNPDIFSPTHKDIAHRNLRVALVFSTWRKHMRKPAPLETYVVFEANGTRPGFGKAYLNAIQEVLKSEIFQVAYAKESLAAKIQPNRTVLDVSFIETVLREAAFDLSEPSFALEEDEGRETEYMASHVVDSLRGLFLDESAKGALENPARFFRAIGV